MGKKVNELTAVSDSNAANNAWLTVKTDPVTGQSYKSSVSQEKIAYGTYRKKYVATGSEGTSFSIPELVGKELLVVTREGSVLYDTTSSPDSTEYTWDYTTFGIHGAPAAGERFAFIYKSPS